MPRVGLQVPLKELFTVAEDIHDGGDQCRIKRVKRIEDGEDRSADWHSSLAVQQGLSHSHLEIRG